MEIQTAERQKKYLSVCYSNGEVELYNPKNFKYMRGLSKLSALGWSHKIIMDSKRDNNGVEKIHVYKTDGNKTLQKHEIQNYHNPNEIKLELVWDDDAITNPINCVAKTQDSKYIYTAQGTHLLEWMQTDAKESTAEPEKKSWLSKFSLTNVKQKFIAAQNWVFGSGGGYFCNKINWNFCGKRSTILDIKLVHNDKRLLIRDNGSSLKVYDTRSRTVLETIPRNYNIRHVDLIENSAATCAYYPDNGNLRMLHQRCSKSETLFTNKSENLHAWKGAVIYSSQNSMLGNRARSEFIITGDESGVLREFSLKKNKLSGKFSNRRTTPIEYLSVSDNHKFMYCVDQKGNLKIYNLKTKRLLRFQKGTYIHAHAKITSISSF